MLKFRSWLQDGLIIALALGSTACSRVGGDQDAAFTQQQSYLGLTSSWDLAGVSWAQDVDRMRERAYGFCNEVRPADRDCPEIQDFSIKTAADVDRIVQEVIRSPEAGYKLGIGERFARGISLMPSRFAKAREHCFSIYRDGESKDARALGPCMASAVGWDYFGFVPVGDALALPTQ